MKCNRCKLVEMLVMARNKEEVVYQCPRCLEIETVKVKKEEENDKQERAKLSIREATK